MDQSEEVVTVMLRHIACKYKEEDIKEVLEQAGFGGQFTMIYVPRKPERARPSNLGYAFVTFLSMDLVDRCRTTFSGQVFGRSSTSKRCEVVLAHCQDPRPCPRLKRLSNSGNRQSA